MRKSRFTEAQIIGMIKEQEAGLPTAELCRKHGLAAANLVGGLAELMLGDRAEKGDKFPVELSAIRWAVLHRS